MIKLHGPKYIKELTKYFCPFTKKTITLHPSKWKMYLQQQAETCSFAELCMIRDQLSNPLIKEVIESSMLYHHNGEEH
jgi:hypothetical protein